MKFRVSYRLPMFFNHTRGGYLHNQHRCFTSLFKKLQTTTRARASVNGGHGSSQGDSFLVPGATVATLLMLGVLHARRLYDEQKFEEAREKGIELEFQPDVKAAFLRLLPLRSISRFWGFLTDMELPVWLRPYTYRAWARAFHSRFAALYQSVKFRIEQLGYQNSSIFDVIHSLTAFNGEDLDEVALPLDEYTSLRKFFVRTLKEGSRPIDHDPQCLISPVDGIVLRCGELRGVGAMIEQVKGCSYSVSSLLGASSFLPMIVERGVQEESGEQENTSKEKRKKSWWKVSLASPKVWDPVSVCPMKGLFYCVIYLKPGDYHRIHSPVDWSILVRRHFSGRLFPVNERATRTIQNLYVENERVVLEGLWKEGFMAIAAIGATNIGSIELFIEPELRTNRPRKKLLHSEPPEEHLYEPEGVGVMLKKGDELAAFNMGSTVVLVFQAPISKSLENGDSSSEFSFCIKRGDRVRVGEALGRWQDF